MGVQSASISVHTTIPGSMECPGVQAHSCSERLCRKTTRAEKGVRYRKPDRPKGCFAFSVPDPLFPANDSTRTSSCDKALACWSPQRNWCSTSSRLDSLSRLNIQAPCQNKRDPRRLWAVDLPRQHPSTTGVTRPASLHFDAPSTMQPRRCWERFHGAY
jgi:hypothetical protein